MTNLINKINLRLDEISLTNKLETELKSLIKNIKSGKGVDKRSMDSDTDGEILADFLTPLFQSVLNDLDDRKGFKKGFRI